jgi:hypothetical protein
VTANESPPYRIDPLNAHHDRAAFASGVEPLDRYLRTQAGQDSRRRVASCYRFLKLATGSRRMFLPITEIAALFSPAATARLPTPTS